MYLKNFGTFMFEVIKKPKLPSQLTPFNPEKGLHESFAERTNVNSVRPCFVVDGKFRNALSRFMNKNEVDVPGSQATAYEKGVNILYCNATPIAGRCSLPKELAQSIITALFDAVADIAQTGMTLNLDFGFAQVRVDNKNMTYKYSPVFVSRTSTPAFSNCFKTSVGLTSNIWKTSTKSNFL